MSPFGTYWISNKKHDRVTKGNCDCPVCRKKHKLQSGSERAEEKLFNMPNGGLRDIKLFCRVFPDGLVGSCGFRFDGFCKVFEDGCVRWNEFGDKMDYSVGKVNPFKVSGGE
jgi:hypothetical protein